MYHISADGKPRVCKAKARCPLSPASEHYATVEAAYTASIDRVLAGSSQFGHEPGKPPRTEATSGTIPASISHGQWTSEPVSSSTNDRPLNWDGTDQMSEAQLEADEAKLVAAHPGLAHPDTSVGFAERQVLRGKQSSYLVGSAYVHTVIAKSENRELVLETVSKLAGEFGMSGGPARYPVNGSEAVLSSKALTYEEIAERSKFLTTDAETTARLLEARSDVPPQVIERLRTPGTAWAHPLSPENADKIEWNVHWSAPEDAMRSGRGQEPPHSQLHARGRLYGDASSYRMLQARLKFAEFSDRITSSVKAGDDVHKLTRELRSADAFLEYNKVQWALSGK